MHKNTFYTLGAKGIAGISFFLLDILIARVLGYDNYNEWGFYFSIAEILKFLARMGVDISSKVFIARSVNEKKEQDEFFQAGFRLEICLTVIVMIIEIAIAYPLTRILGYPQKYPHLFEIFLAGSIFTSLYSMLCFFKEASVGFLKYINLFWITAVEFLGYLICAYIGMKMGGTVGLGGGYSAAIIFAILFCVWLYRDRDVCIQNSKSIQRKKGIIFKYALSLIFVNMGGLVLSEIDVVMLGFFLPGQVGIYKIPKNILDKLINVPLAICLGAIPMYVIFDKDNYKAKERDYFKLVSGYVSGIIVIAVVMGVLGRQVIFRAYGTEYVESVAIFYWLIPYFIIFSLTAFISSFLSYQKREKELMVSHSVMIAGNIIFNFILIPRYGAVGAAVATDISLVLFLILLLIYHAKYFKNLHKEYENTW